MSNDGECLAGGSFSSDSREFSWPAFFLRLPVNWPSVSSLVFIPLQLPPSLQHSATSAVKYFHRCM